MFYSYYNYIKKRETIDASLNHMFCAHPNLLFKEAEKFIFFIFCSLNKIPQFPRNITVKNFFRELQELILEKILYFHSYC